MPKYAVVIHHHEANWESQPEAHRTRVLKRYYEWSDSLSEQGAFIGGHALRDGGRVLRPDGDQITDGPYAETKEVVGGFVLIEAPDMDAAVLHARACPGLEIGDWVEVRQVSEHQRPE